MKRILLFISVFICFCAPVYAEDVILDATPSHDYIEYINAPRLLSDEPGNYQPPILSLVSPAVLQSTELPSSYDARTENKIYYSGVGQKSDGTCWAFASNLCAETALGAKVDLSEQHVKYTMSSTGGNPFGYIRSPSGGGNFKMYTAYATSWRGVVLESDDPYTYGDTERNYETVTAIKPVSYHVQETIEIPNPANDVALVSPEERVAHVNEVKYYVYKYGCCFSAVYWSASYKSEDGSSYHNPSNTSTINHAICIIGWDDNYSKDNFKDKPENNGAFIIKNSQGDTGGYYYLSYEDVYAGWDASCVVSVEDKYNYGEIYTYNHFEPGGALSGFTGVSVCTNVFESGIDGEYISAVGTLTKTRNLMYDVYISTTDDGSSPTMDSYTYLTGGVFEMPGYHTVKLDEPFLLGDAGTKYCVRFVYYCNGNPYEVPVEMATSSNGVTIQNVYSKPGRSHFRIGSTYYDMGQTSNANLYINAYTDADYDITFGDDIHGTFSINGGSPSSCSGSITAGLNDEITVNFENTDSNITAYYINDTKYDTTDSVTLKITEPLKITAEYKISFADDIHGTFNINGGSPSPCSGSITAGLNDEITVNFENTDPEISAYYINDTKYDTTDSVTLKITEPLEITAEKKVESTVSSENESLTLDTLRSTKNTVILNINAEFSKEHTVYAALYTGSKLVGIKQLDLSTENLQTEFSFSQKPDKIKLITTDKKFCLTPALEALESEI